jgi:RNA polymerase sigma-70 factor (ECF subfamily)
MSAEPFVAHRSLLFTVAYEMLGSAADAEDVVQETWLRWDGIGAAGRADVRDPRAYLVRIVTRQALNRLRTMARQRVDYVGEWLPEPLLTSPDVAEDVELAESVSMAMLTVLETLGHAERAVFVLREVFDVPYDEIASAVGKSEAAVRQIAHRARGHVAARRPRVEVSRAEQQQVVERFLAAITTGNLPALLEVLAPDVLLVADGGGLVPAARKPIRGADRLIAAISAWMRLVPADFGGEAIWLNGGPGVRLDAGGEVAAALSLTIENGRVTHIYGIRNPHKLLRLGEEADLSR